MLGGRGWLGRYQQEEGEGAATGILGTNRPLASQISTCWEGGVGFAGTSRREEGAANSILGTNRPSAPLVSTKRRGASLPPHHRYQHDRGG